MAPRYTQLLLGPLGWAGIDEALDVGAMYRPDSMPVIDVKAGRLE